MAWWNALGNIFTSSRDVDGVMTRNKASNSDREGEEKLADVGRDVASLHQFAAEFHDRMNRTKWDSFVDGLNRLPRPLLTFAIIGFFVLAPASPARFLEIAKAYQVMPPGYWALLSVIVGFYFGGRMQLKSQDMTVKKDAMQAAKDLISMKKEFRQLENEDTPLETKIYQTAVEAGEKLPFNKVVAEWLQSKK